MPVNAPIPLARQLSTLELIGAPAELVVDVGCGTGELVLALARRGCSAVGVDLDPASIETARAAAEGLPIELWCADVADAVLPSADLVVCVGSTHAYGSGPAALTSALAAFRACLRPGGFALVGEGFHQQPLPEPYAALLGSPTGIERTHAENVEASELSGFHCLHATTASPQEWDDFEWAHHRGQLARAAALPEPERSDQGERIVRWRDAYLRWGRDTMGFGLYLLQVR